MELLTRSVFHIIFQVLSTVRYLMGLVYLIEYDEAVPLTFYRFLLHLVAALGNDYLIVLGDTEVAPADL
jgi:hypothetical protein